MYNPDFIHPLPAGPFTSIEDDLDHDARHAP